MNSGAEDMEPIEHFFLSLIAGLGVGLHLDNKKRKYLLLILLAFAAASIDLDHILPIYQESGVKIFHNFFVFLLLPFLLFLAFYVYERGKSSTMGQRAGLALSVMFIGHMFLDGVSGTMPFFYPVRSEMFTISNIGITVDSTFFTLTSLHVVMVIWGVVIIGGNLVENLIYNDVEGHVSINLDFKAHRMTDKGRKSPLQAFINAFPLMKT